MNANNNFTGLRFHEEEDATIGITNYGDNQLECLECYLRICNFQTGPEVLVFGTFKVKESGAILKIARSPEKQDGYGVKITSAQQEWCLNMVSDFGKEGRLDYPSALITVKEKISKKHGVRYYRAYLK